VQPAPDRVAAVIVGAMIAAALTADSAENVAEKPIRNAGNAHPVMKMTVKHPNTVEMISKKEDLYVGMKMVLPNAAEMISRKEDLSAETTDPADVKTAKRSRSGKSSGKENIPMIEKKGFSFLLNPDFCLRNCFRLKNILEKQPERDIFQV
jgi:hypothetical protein